jgi:hypothetical protein
MTMDDAHNARTPISFDSLKRFAPMAVLELTATPRGTTSLGDGGSCVSKRLASIRYAQKENQDAIDISRKFR